MSDEIDTTPPERIWAGKNLTEYYVNGQKLSVTFHDGVWSAVSQPDWQEYIRADIAQAERQRAEKAEAELASGSFYKESDIDELQDRASLVATSAAHDVLAERRRQIEAEGWTAEHDDRHIQGELAAAAVCYIVPSADRLDTYRLFWPPTWDKQWWKPAGPPDGPTARRRDLVRGVAMGLAEIERLDRFAGRRHAAGDTSVSRVRIVTTPTSMSLHYAWRAYSPERPDIGWTYGATEEQARERFQDELRQDEGGEE